VKPRQRVRYAGPRFPTLETGSEGFVSDANNSLSTLSAGWLYVDFPGCQPRRQECKVTDLEPIGGTK
jgi:hypothetical protein